VLAARRIGSGPDCSAPGRFILAATEQWPPEAAFVERVAQGERRVARTLGAERVGCRRGTRGAVCVRCERGSHVIYKAYIETYN